MIKKINHIKNFGVFNDYRRSGTIQDFEKVNIIYGWNYSGKTTISRVFQCFENCMLKEHYPQADILAGLTQRACGSRGRELGMGK
tara:strand:- start:116 stop:370 length:255 start_codon:yes stop_codon:yes gene_type:complete